MQTLSSAAGDCPRRHFPTSQPFLGNLIAAMAPSPAIPPSLETERIDYLDGWRGLAIALVLQEHFFKVAGFDSGRLGVDIFFCLSGMLMSHILFVRRVPLGTFYKRRISRIIPVFALFVLGVYGAAWLASHPFTAVELVATATFLRTYVPASPDIWHTGLPLGHLWSLNVEEHCYVVLSLVTLVVPTRSRAAAILLALGFAAIAMLYAYDHGLFAAPADPEIRTETAAASLLISAGYALLRDRFAPLVRGWMPLTAFLVAVPFYWHGLEGGIAEVSTPLLLAFAVNHLKDASRWLRSALALTPLRLLGLWSYSIYLWQQPFFQFKGALPPGAALGGALLAGIASFHLFENPVRRWLNRHW